MAVNPVRPFITEQGDETARLMEAFVLCFDFVPHFRMRLEWKHTPMVMVCQRDHVERRNVACVEKIILHGAGSIGKAGVPMKISPKKTGGFVGNQQWIALAYQAAVGFRLPFANY